MVSEYIIINVLWMLIAIAAFRDWFNLTKEIANKYLEQKRLLASERRNDV